MLTESQLNNLLDQHGVTEEGRAIVQKIRNSEPSRRVGGGASNVACQYPSHKMGCYLQAESHTNELAALYMWDHDSTTYEIYDQSPQIKLNYVNSNGKKGAYLTRPDYFIIQDGFIGWVECKPEEWLRTKQMDGSLLFVRSPEGTWRLPAGSDYAAQFGLGFAVRSSQENSKVLVRNLVFLSDYWYEEESTPAIPRPLESFNPELGNAAYCTLADLQRHCVSEDTDEIYRAIVRGDIFVDLRKDVLAEPESTRVFRSESLANAFALRDQAKLPIPPDEGLHTYPIELVQNARIIWRDVHFTIMSVSEKTIFLKHPQNGPVALSHEDFVSYVTAGEIRGAESICLTSTTTTEDRIATASPRDLNIATRRFRLLAGDQTVLDKSESPPPARTVRYWKQLQRQGQALFGDGFLGLISTTSRRGPRERILCPEIIEIMRAVIDEKYLNANPESIRLCYGHVCNRCEDADLVPPSEKTFRREIKITCDENRRIAIQQGEGVAYKSSPFVYTLCATSPRHGDRPFEIGHIDSTEIDLQLVDSKNRRHLGKAWLTLMLDAYSRSVLAFIILFDKPSYRSSMLIIRECLRRHGRIPSMLVVDGGKEFQNNYFEILLARLSTTKMTRPRKKPRFGSVIERNFGVTNENFFHNLQGNNKPLQNPREMSASHDPRKQSIWPLPQLMDELSRYFYFTYANCVHTSLGLSPATALAEGFLRTGSRPMRLVAMTLGLAILCLPSTRTEQAKIIPARGIKINHLHYFHASMRDPKLTGTKVHVRYDPYDVSRAYAFINGSWVPCVSEYAESFRGRSEKELAIASSEVNSLHKQKGARRIINAQLLARQFDSIQVTQARLIQEQHDAEQRLAQPMTLDAPLQSDIALSMPDADIPSADNGWAKVPVISLGEFK